MRYFVSGILCTPAPSIGRIFDRRIDNGKSSNDHDLRNLVVKPAYGPNNNFFFPCIIRVSKCGTDIGGAHNAAFPYTFASCCAIISGFSHTNHWPLTGNQPYCFASAIPAFCNNGNAHHPAPTKTKSACICLCVLFFVLCTCNVRCHFVVFSISTTR